MTEVVGFRRAKIRDGFRYIHNKDMRTPMMYLILSDAQPLPNAHEVARIYNMRWEQFVRDFAEGLKEMYDNKVGLRGL